MMEQDQRLNYPEKLTAYVEKHKISEFARIFPSLGNFKGKKKLVLVLNINSMCELIKLLDVQNAIGEIMGILPSAIHICDISVACVVVTFLVTIPVAEFIFTSDDVFTHKQKTQFRKLSVMRLECNGYTYEFGEEFATAGT